MEYIEKYICPTITSDDLLGPSESSNSLQLTLPPVCYAVVGVPMSIYFDNIVLTEKPERYRFKVEGDFGTADARRWTITQGCRRRRSFTFGFVSDAKATGLPERNRFFT